MRVDRSPGPSSCRYKRPSRLLRGVRINTPPTPPSGTSMTPPAGTASGPSGRHDGRTIAGRRSAGMMDAGHRADLEPNRARLKTSRDDVVNPWLSNRNNFRNMDEIVASAVQPGTTDREKATPLV